MKVTYHNLKKDVEYTGIYNNKAFAILITSFGNIHIDYDGDGSDISGDIVMSAIYYPSVIYDTPLFKALHG